MNIELWYDPILPKTTLKIDGRWQDSADIYSFLYPVNSYILQTWLHKSSSWQGLENQLYELARDESIRLTFRGCKTDYEDLSECLEGKKDIEFEFEAWNPSDAYNEKAKRIKNKLKELNKTSENLPPFPSEWTERVKKAEKICEGGSDAWKMRIGNDEDMDTAVHGGAVCCIVDEKLLSDYDALRSLGKLTTSLRRPADAVCCVIPSDEKRREMERYACMYPELQFRFAASENECDKAMYEKYGKAYELRAMLENCRAARDYMLELYEKQEEYTHERESLSEGYRKKTLTVSEVRRYTFLKNILLIMQYKKRTLDELSEIIENNNTRTEAST